MKRALLTLSLLALGVTAVAAQDPIAARKEAMKSLETQSKAGAQMARGSEPFDLAKAKAMFAAYQEVAAKAPGLFPDTSKTGGKTSASPKIWENKADFDAKFAKFAADAKAASDNTKDLASFRASFGGLARSCVGCHETYRAE